MKISWGTGIAIFYSFFVIVMVGMVVYSKSFDHSLVVDNYYEEDLKYQSHLDKLNNSKRLATDLQIQVEKENGAVALHFPKEIQQVEGSVLFYRADDKRMDVSLKIAVDSNGTFLAPIQNLTPGKWTVKVDWQGDGKPFFKEETLVL
jgi:hypothetical protein